MAKHFKDADGEPPREKIFKFGVSSLSNAELMAVFLSSGTVGRGVLDIARDLLQKYGGLQELGRLSPSEYLNNKGIGEAKAAKLAAAFELGSRLQRQHTPKTPLDSPERIFQHFSPQLTNLSTEHVLVATVDTRLILSSTTTISTGTVNASTAHPRDILKPVITRNAYGFVVIHNHPSGDPTPSHADQRITARIKQAAELMQVSFIDHLIIGRRSDGREPYFSFRAANLLD